MKREKTIVNPASSVYLESTLVSDEALGVLCVFRTGYSEGIRVANLYDRKLTAEGFIGFIETEHGRVSNVMQFSPFAVGNPYYFDDTNMFNGHTTVGMDYAIESTTKKLCSKQGMLLNYMDTNDRCSPSLKSERFHMHGLDIAVLRKYEKVCRGDFMPDDIEEYPKGGDT